MTEHEAELPTDRSTAQDWKDLSDQLPAKQHEVVRDISLNRRQSRTIVPPRKWRKIGLRQIVCPECRAIVGGISDGFWHLQTAHNQGQGVDLEAWGQELRAELDEFIDAGRGRRGLIEEPGQRRIHLGAAMIGLIVIASIWAVILIAGLITRG